MGLEIFIILLVFLAFLFALGMPLFFTFKKLFERPKEKVIDYNARQQTVNGLFSPKITSEALKIFEYVWNDKIDKQNLKIIFDKLNIYWKKDPIELGQTYTINGKKISMASGLTRTKKDIDVWIYDVKKGAKEKKKEEIKISDTAFVHELIHIALWNLEGDPDADHEGNLYKGWYDKHTEVERTVNLLLKEKGL